MFTWKVSSYRCFPLHDNPGNWWRLIIVHVIHWADVGVMLGRRLWRRPSITPTSVHIDWNVAHGSQRQRREETRDALKTAPDNKTIPASPSPSSTPPPPPCNPFWCICLCFCQVWASTSAVMATGTRRAAGVSHTNASDFANKFLSTGDISLILAGLPLLSPLIRLSLTPKCMFSSCYGGSQHFRSQLLVYCCLSITQGNIRPVQSVW